MELKSIEFSEFEIDKFESDTREYSLSQASVNILGSDLIELSSGSKAIMYTICFVGIDNLLTAYRLLEYFNINLLGFNQLSVIFIDSQSAKVSGLRNLWAKRFPSGNYPFSIQFQVADFLMLSNHFFEKTNCVVSLCSGCVTSMFASKMISLMLFMGAMGKQVNSKIILTKNVLDSINSLYVEIDGEKSINDFVTYELFSEIMTVSDHCGPEAGDNRTPQEIRRDAKIRYLFVPTKIYQILPKEKWHRNNDLVLWKMLSYASANTVEHLLSPEFLRKCFLNGFIRSKDDPIWSKIEIRLNPNLFLRPIFANSLKHSGPDNAFRFTDIKVWTSKQIKYVKEKVLYI